MYRKSMILDSTFWKWRDLKVKIGFIKEAGRNAKCFKTGVPNSTLKKGICRYQK